MISINEPTDVETELFALVSWNGGNPGLEISKLIDGNPWRNPRPYAARSSASLTNERRMAQGNFTPRGLVVQNTRTGAIGTIVADRPQWSHRAATLLASGARNMVIAVQDHDTNVTRKWDCRRLVII